MLSAAFEMARLVIVLRLRSLPTIQKCMLCLEQGESQCVQPGTGVVARYLSLSGPGQPLSLTLNQRRLVAACRPCKVLYENHSLYTPLRLIATKREGVRRRTS
jgi:hypothetical protein